MILSYYMYRLGHSYKTTNISLSITIQYNGKVKCNAICTYYACLRSILSPVARLALPYFPTLSHEMHNLTQKIFELKICVLIFSTMFYKALLILKSSGRKYKKWA